MPIYKIFEDGKEINRIVADEDFVKTWCPENGYTYELESEPGPEPEPEPEPAYTAEDLLAALLRLEENTNGGGNFLVSLAALGAEKYNALSAMLHACNLCGEVGA